MARFRPGVRAKYSDGRIYRVMPHGSHRREDGGKLSKAEKKRQRKDRRLESLRHQVGKP